jgi:hypothetical protein
LLAVLDLDQSAIISIVTEARFAHVASYLGELPIGSMTKLFDTRVEVFVTLWDPPSGYRQKRRQLPCLSQWFSSGLNPKPSMTAVCSIDTRS